MQKTAEELLDDWCASLVREAVKITEDAEAISNLPQGIRKNYEGGIRQLELFIKLKIPVKRVLRTCLELYNDWCYDLYVIRDLDYLKTLIESTVQIVEQLVPICTKSCSHTPENQALSQYFLFKGFIADDPNLAIKEYEEALAWNLANDNAKTLLGDSYEAIIQKQIETAIECVEKKQFNEAYAVLDSIEEKATDKEHLVQARAFTLFRHAQALAEDGMFRDSLQKAREALELESSQKVFQEFVKEMEELAPEEENLRNLKEANEALNEDRYDQAIGTAIEIPGNSKFYENAQQLLSAAFFHRGISSANNEHYNDAEKDLRKALELNDDTNAKKIISKQLSVILNICAVRLINKTQETEKEFGEAIKEIIGQVESIQRG
jgi:tetratricopeptide (TPR) repeat protein